MGADETKDETEKGGSGEDRIIRPTGTCFDDSLDLLVELLKAHGDNGPAANAERVATLFLVHAVVGALGGESAHAWVEDDQLDACLFVALHRGKRITFAAPRFDYYETYQVLCRWRYSYPQAFELNHASGNYGPWEPRLRELTAKATGKERVIATVDMAAARLHGPAATTCPRCGRVSYSASDALNGYCGACKQFYEDMRP